MTTKIYGHSDDLIEMEGDYDAEVGASYKGSDAMFLSDGTVITWKYADSGIWKAVIKEKGSLFDRFDPCTDPDAIIYSDIVYMHDGIKWAYSLSLRDGVDLERAR